MSAATAGPPEAPPEGMGPPAPATGDGHPPAPEKKYTKTVALYLRVSTDEQTTDNQERELRDLADRAGWKVVDVYRDHAISGAKGRDKRPALDAMLKDAVRRKFDTVASWSVDRLGRSSLDLINILQELRASSVDLFLLKQAFDTSTPTGKAMYQLMGVFAELEREIIRERVKSGMARARAQGKRLGKPAVSAAKVEAIKLELAKGTGMLKTARLCGVGTYTVQRIKKEMV